VRGGAFPSVGCCITLGNCRRTDRFHVAPR
jgi:hypothetical protein